MITIYLSPHLDDVALSCGGLIWQQTQAGQQVAVWTVCAGDPPKEELSSFAAAMHDRWDIGPRATAARRAEDVQSCSILGAGFRHLAVPDAIYRRHPDSGEPLYSSDAELFGRLAASEMELVDEIRYQLERELPKNSRLICPLGVGQHVDHQLTRAATEGLDQRLSYYADYPYVTSIPQQVENLVPAGWKKSIHPIAADAVRAWQHAVAAYSSQVDTFWEDKNAMFEAIALYKDQQGGVVTWEMDDQ